MKHSNGFNGPKPAAQIKSLTAKQSGGANTGQTARNTPTGAGGPFPTDVPRTPVVIQSITLLK